MADQLVVQEAGAAWADTAPRPWRRLVARAFDLTVVTALAAGGLIGLAVWLLPADAREIPIGVVAVAFLVPPVRGVVSALLNALLLRALSTTPGKWLCGIRIVRKDGGRLSYWQALKREFDALFAGCGVFIPLLGLITMWFAFSRLREHGAMSWDEHQGLVALQRPSSGAQVVLTLLAFALWAAVQGAVLLLWTMMKSATT